jgi:CubicO group peptidase (beta-lactamase class C family)
MAGSACCSPMTVRSATSRSCPGIICSKRRIGTGNPTRSRREKATRYFGYCYLFWLFPGEKRRFALLGVYGQSIFVDPELKLVMVITAAAKTATVGTEPLGRERDALWRGAVRTYGSW